MVRQKTTTDDSPEEKAGAGHSIANHSPIVRNPNSAGSSTKNPSSSHGGTSHPTPTKNTYPSSDPQKDDPITDGDGLPFPLHQAPNVSGNSPEEIPKKLPAPTPAPAEHHKKNHHHHHKH